MVYADGRVLALSAISLGVAQMIFSVYTVKDMKIDATTYPLLYSGILASIIWLLYQYKIEDKFSGVYSIMGLCVQLYILNELKSRDRSMEKQR